MSETGAISPPPTVDPRSGFDPISRQFYSLRPATPLPPPSRPLSFTAFALSLLSSPLPDHPAFVDAVTGTAVTFPAFFSQVRSLAAALRSDAGVQKGLVAFVLAPVCLEIPVIYFALLSLGAIVSPANPLSTPSELQRLVDLSRPSLAFATAGAATKLPSHLKVILLDSDEFKLFLSGGSGGGSGCEKMANVEVRQADVAAIQYSSGTTGAVKAAAVPHRCFIAMAAKFNALRPKPPPWRSGPEVAFLTAPLFHTMGFTFLLKGVALGETIVLMCGGGGFRCGVEGMLRVAERWRVTEITAAPPLVVEMARSEEAGRFDLTALKRIVCGGAPLNEAAAEQFMERFPQVELRQGYGSTEAGGISLMIGYEECRNIRSVGRLSQYVEAKIIDNTTCEFLSVGQIGELWVRGPEVIKGYVGDDEANASTFTSDGWLKTGDLCYIDQNGFLYIVDRLKELIKYKGYQVPPAELEHLLQSLPGVADVVVIPYPHEEFGQLPMALIVREKGKNLNEEEVIDFVAKQVAPYKKIRKVAFINSIPKSPSGKILRRELRDQILGKINSKL